MVVINEGMVGRLYGFPLGVQYPFVEFIRKQGRKLPPPLKLEEGYAESCPDSFCASPPN